MNKGLVYIVQPFDGQALKPFQQLIQEFNLQVPETTTDFYKWDTLQKNKEWENI